jgi:uncharacterized RDD family membrane protein YckC
MIAQVIDGTIIGMILLIFIILLAVINGDGQFLIPIIIPFYSIFPILYYLIQEGKNGQTFGKSLAHIKVMHLDGKPLTPLRVVKSALWKGLLFPILNVVDAVIGIFVLHTDTQQRYTQFEMDLIVVAVPMDKKKLSRNIHREEDESEKNLRSESDDDDDGPGIKQEGERDLNNEGSSDIDPPEPSSADLMDSLMRNEEREEFRSAIQESKDLYKKLKETRALLEKTRTSLPVAETSFAKPSESADMIPRIEDSLEKGHEVQEELKERTFDLAHGGDITSVHYMIEVANAQIVRDTTLIAVCERIQKENG